MAEENGYETQLAQYLQEKIKPGLSRSTIPLVARSIAKEIARREPPEPPEGQGGAEGEQGILRFWVRGDDAWLTAEKPDEDQRVDAPGAQGLLPIVDAINEGGGRRRSE